jgi:hypothetical protein
VGQLVLLDRQQLLLGELVKLGDQLLLADRVVAIDGQAGARRPGALFRIAAEAGQGSSEEARPNRPA